MLHKGKLQAALNLKLAANSTLSMFLLSINCKHIVTLSKRCTLAILQARH